MNLGRQNGIVRFECYDIVLDFWAVDRGSGGRLCIPLHRYKDLIWSVRTRSGGRSHSVTLQPDHFAKEPLLFT
jgi:hypothetical protein